MISRYAYIYIYIYIYTYVYPATARAPARARARPPLRLSTFQQAHYYHCLFVLLFIYFYDIVSVPTSTTLFRLSGLQYSKL